MSGLQPTTSLPASEGTSTSEKSSEQTLPVTISRDNLGRFVRGVSGNPNGKPVGAKNRISFIKHAIEEALVRDIADEANAIILQAITLAKQGDTDMIKFVLGEVLKDVRKGGVEDEDLLRGAKTVHVQITQYVGQQQARPEDALEGEYEPLEHP